MPRKNIAGTWEGAPAFRWTRMVKGVRWRLLCRHQKPGEAKDNTGWLGLSESDWTEARSQAAANAWWDQQAKPKVLFPEGQAKFVDDINKLNQTLDKAGIENTADNKQFIRQIFDNIDKVQNVTQKGKKVKDWADAYLVGKLADKKSPGRYDNLKRSIRKFVESVGADSPVTAIDWQAWDNLSNKIRAGDLSDSYKRDIISDCRNFVRWLERREIIPEVKNIAETKIKVRSKKIKHFTKDELQLLLKQSKSMLNCFLLFFANCGFRQIDVATLTHSMIANGYVTRKRAKTEDTDAPIVSWKLWPETIKAINKFKTDSKDPDALLFTRDNGLPWVIEELNEKDNRSRDDVFRRDLWLPFNAKHKSRLPTDLMRGSCANLMKTDSDRTNQISVQTKYLGLSPSGIALKHYIDPPQEDLDAAVMRLREVLFP